MIQLYSAGTEFLANAITLTRGTAADIVSVGVHHSVDPNTVPGVGDFTAVTLVKPGDPLADGNNLDVLSLVGPKAGADLELPPGTYQRWVLVSTATEDIVRKVDVVEVL